MGDIFDDFPRRFPLAHLPTPLVEMANLRAALGNGCPRLFIKRDDCTGLAGGGNKTRKLEFLIGEALAQGADTIVTTGALQSNHARQTAAAAVAAGLRATLILMDIVPYEGRRYRSSGNRLLDEILGADVVVVPTGEAPADAFKRAMNGIEARGGKSYFIPAGGSNATGSLGYAAAYIEITDQLAGRGIRDARLVHASSSGGTQAGLIAGRGLRQDGPSIHGINVYRADHEVMSGEILKLARATAAKLGLPEPAADAVLLEEGFMGARYGMPTPGMVEAVELVARTEAVLLDPVYTGKAMAGMIALIRRGAFAKDETLVFLHTGGMPGLFAYEEEFLAAGN
ncbi:MAG TPA: D-cysteine desulfhydrase family protein [Parvibaculum sp.]